MIKQIKKTLLVILFSSFLLNTSGSVTEAFLDSDLGLNLYKDLDEWLEDFNEKQYIYELSGQDSKNISKEVNKILNNEKIWSCLIDWITEEKVSSIVDWNMTVLIENLKEECYNPENKTFSSKKMASIVSSLWNIKEYYKNKAEQKTESIHEISRIWMYTDWNIENSPFDIIKDIQDIDKIMFSWEIEYIPEESAFLSEYKKKPDDSSSSDCIDWNCNWWSVNQLTQISDSEVSTWNNTPDWNNYLNSTSSNESWLSQDSFNLLIWSLNNSNNTSIDTPSLSIDSSYEKVTDNEKWDCNQFFCVEPSSSVNKNNALDYWEDNSIENIIRTSNKHLKKAANTSLVQSKMTTNNFEISLRDLDLQKMFHPWYIITSKTPPILDVKKINNNPDVDDLDIKKLLTEKYKHFNLDYTDSNNLNKFKHLESELKDIVHSLENPSKRAENLKNEYREILKLKEAVNSFNNKKVTNELNNEIINDFDTQFNELEQYNKNILDYINNIDIIIKNLKKIKTYNP